MTTDYYLEQSQFEQSQIALCTALYATPRDSAAISTRDEIKTPGAKAPAPAAGDAAAATDGHAASVLVPTPLGGRRMSGRDAMVARMRNGGRRFPGELADAAASTANLSGAARLVFNMRHAGELAEDAAAAANTATLYGGRR